MLLGLVACVCACVCMCACAYVCVRVYARACIIKREEMVHGTDRLTFRSEVRNERRLPAFRAQKKTSFKKIALIKFENKEKRIF